MKLVAAILLVGLFLTVVGSMATAPAVAMGLPDYCKGSWGVDSADPPPTNGQALWCEWLVYSGWAYTPY